MAYEVLAIALLALVSAGVGFLFRNRSFADVSCDKHPPRCTHSRASLADGAREDHSTKARDSDTDTASRTSELSCNLRAACEDYARGQ